jgi:hypothetical protein
MEAARFYNAILRDNLNSKVALGESDISCTNPNILVVNDCADNKLHIEITVGSRDYEDEGDESDQCEAIPTDSQQ